jgi:hypothetical protein
VELWTSRRKYCQVKNKDSLNQKEVIALRIYKTIR